MQETVAGTNDAESLPHTPISFQPSHEECHVTCHMICGHHCCLMYISPSSLGTGGETQDMATCLLDVDGPRVGRRAAKKITSNFSLFFFVNICEGGEGERNGQ